jgi:hypothetical protein
MRTHPLLVSLRSTSNILRTFSVILGLSILPSTHADVVGIVAGPRVLPPDQIIEFGGTALLGHSLSPEWNVVKIESGTNLTLRLSEFFTEASNIIWSRDGEQIGNSDTGRSLSLTDFTAEQDGYYEVKFGHANSANVSVGVTILATPLARAPLLNLSVRGQISPDAPSLVAGFVIDEEGLSISGRRWVLIRVIGPSLADFDVSNPLADPIMFLVNPDTGVSPSIAFPTVVYPDGSTPESRYYKWIERISAAVGAFPIPLPESGVPPPAEEALLIGLSPGAYTVTAMSDSNASGEAMIEIYEVSEEIAAATSESPPSFEPVDPGS